MMYLPLTHMITLVKGEERYIYLFPDSDDGRSNILRVIGRHANSTELSLTWYDAALISEKIRKTMKK